MTTSAQQFRNSLLVMLVAVASSTRACPAVGAESIECRDMIQNYAAAKKDLIDRQVNTYLARAAQKGCTQFVTELLKDGASVHARRREGDAALHHAVKATQPDTTRVLLDAGADIEQRDLSGATPLYLAVDAGRVATVRLLLERGAIMDAPGKSAATPLISAAYNGRENLVTLLLDRNGDFNLADNTGKTAIVYAAARGFSGIVEKLLSKGVDVNRRYSNDLTALMWAAGHANDAPEVEAVKTVELLIAKGARIDDVDNRGWTALMIAAELGHGAVIDVLLKRGARRYLSDGKGKTALDLANASVRERLLTK
jgi:uncharacterized protein